MSNKKHLSYSGYQKYCQCPHKYDLHYNQKVRPESISSVLLFGSATDKAMNLYLLDADRVNALVEAQIDLVRLFTEKIDLLPVDFDADLITELTRPYLMAKLKASGWEGTNLHALWHALFAKYKDGEVFSAGQASAIKWLVHYSFLEKIALILTAFDTYVRPRIEEVTDIQGSVKRGIYDLKATLVETDGEFICDVKTAARPYAWDAAETSVQMAGYGAEQAAYFVFPKTVKKRKSRECIECGHVSTKDAVCMNRVKASGLMKHCHGEMRDTVRCEVIPQVVLGKVSQRMRDIVEDAYVKTEALIEAKVFPRNLTNCGKQFGRPCEYINLCYKNSMKGLVQK